jgi:hypothetical protein
LVTLVPKITRQHPHSDSGLGERYGLGEREGDAEDVLLVEESSSLRENMLDVLLMRGCSGLSMQKVAGGSSSTFVVTMQQGTAAVNLGELDAESAVSKSSAVDAIRERKQGIA